MSREHWGRVALLIYAIFIIILCILCNSVVNTITAGKSDLRDFRMGILVIHQRLYMLGLLYSVNPTRT